MEKEFDIIDVPAPSLTLEPLAEEKAPLPVEPDRIPEYNGQTWNLFLVNLWNKLPDDFTVDLTYLKNGHAVDSRAYPDLQDMMDDCRAAGLSPLICSSYRTYEKQETLFKNRVNR